jgi:hypothetical protein
MNVSHENKVVWWAPERTGTNMISKIFENFGFEFDGKPLGDVYHSHEFSVPSGCDDYTLICSVRNPYDRILGIFLNFTDAGNRVVFTKDKKQEFIKTFEKFILTFVNRHNIYNKTKNEMDKPSLFNYFDKMNFYEKLPDRFLKIENIEKELSEIDFISQSEKWINGEIKHLIYHNKFHKKRPFSYNEIYTYKGANLIYQYFKKHFIMLDYNPFSFTQEILTEQDKKIFLHDIIED